MSVRKSQNYKKIFGTSGRPRLSVFRSNKAIYAQAIDDEKGMTILEADSGKVEVKSKKPIEIAFLVGELLAKEANVKKITSIVFDRGSYRYHGQVKAVAEGVRKGGIKI